MTEVGNIRVLCHALAHVPQISSPLNLSSRRMKASSLRHPVINSSSVTAPSPSTSRASNRSLALSTGSNTAQSLSGSRSSQARLRPGHSRLTPESRDIRPLRDEAGARSSLELEQSLPWLEDRSSSLTGNDRKLEDFDFCKEI